jgi:hypothetical protein
LIVIAPKPQQQQQQQQHQQQQQQQQNGKLRCYSMLYLCSEATIVFVLAVPVRVS